MFSIWTRASFWTSFGLELAFGTYDVPPTSSIFIRLSNPSGTWFLNYPLHVHPRLESYTYRMENITLPTHSLFWILELWYCTNLLGLGELFFARFTSFALLFAEKCLFTLQIYIFLDIILQTRWTQWTIPLILLPNPYASSIAYQIHTAS